MYIYIYIFIQIGINASFCDPSPSLSYNPKVVWRLSQLNNLTMDDAPGQVVTEVVEKLGRVVLQIHKDPGIFGCFLFRESWITSNRWFFPNCKAWNVENWDKIDSHIKLHALCSTLALHLLEAQPVHTTALLHEPGRPWMISHDLMLSYAFHQWGIPNSWMGFVGENPIKTDVFVVPLF